MFLQQNLVVCCDYYQERRDGGFLCDEDGHKRLTGADNAPKVLEPDMYFLSEGHG